MKKGLFLAMFAAVSMFAYSQDITWNVKGGINMSNFSGIKDSKVKVGYQIGVGMEYMFNDAIGLQPSLMFTTKGAKTDLVEVGGKTFTASANPMYIELPVMVAYKLPIADEQNLVFKAGPYVAYGVAGQYALNDNLKADIFSKNDNNYFGKANPFDMGIAVGVAYEFNRFFVDVVGDFGLTKFTDVKVGNKDDIRTMNASIGLGYRF